MAPITEKHKTILGGLESLGRRQGEGGGHDGFLAAIGGSQTTVRIVTLVLTTLLTNSVVFWVVRAYLPLSLVLACVRPFLIGWGVVGPPPKAFWPNLSSFSRCFVSHATIDGFSPKQPPCRRRPNIHIPEFI